MNNVPKQLLLDETPVDLHRGLAAEQVAASVAVYGKNILTPPARDPWWALLLEKFADPTIRILLAAAVVSLLMTVLEKFVLAHPEASFIDAAGIILAILLATLAGFFSEMKSAREFELLNKVKDDIRVKVLREGQLSEIQIGDLAVGDLVHLDPGDKVPADGIVLDALGLLVDQSLMTGESVPVEKQAFHGRGELRPLLNGTPGDGTRIDEMFRIWRGTMVGDGHGMFLVTEIGDMTRLGQIAGALGKEGENDSETPLTRKLTVLAKQISVVGISGAMAIFTVMTFLLLYRTSEGTFEVNKYFPLRETILLVLSLGAGWFGRSLLLDPFLKSMGMEIRSFRLKGLAALPIAVTAAGFLIAGSAFFSENTALGMTIINGMLLNFIIAVTIIVVAVPEGLPMMVAISLAMNMMKMARENCLIRKLIASETIGSATVVCSDKTGTLTQNRMCPSWLLIGMRELNGVETVRAPEMPEWPRLVDSIAANTEAALNIQPPSEDGNTPLRVQGIGNPTECALLQLLHHAGVDYRDHREKHPRVWELAHNSQRKLSMTMVETPTKKICHIKGAPEILIARCSHVSIDGVREPIGAHRSAIDAALTNASEQALRVIALTEKEELDECFDKEHPDRCLRCDRHTLIALVGIADPIRPEVPAAVATCREAGVDVKMITGDAVPTAVAIARQAGILRQSASIDHQEPDGELVLTSDELATLADAELIRIMPRLRVLARSTPMDKLRLIKAMHYDGQVVAMTGDGTNDAPALKFADVGISMGQTGTEVAKEAGDIVLLDDNFKSIVTGIWWGRTLYQNIQKFLQFQLSVNVVALTCALIGPFIGVPLPLTVPQLLWINIIMDTFAAIALSSDPPRSGTMRRPPIPRDASIITPSMGVTIFANGLYQVLILFTVLSFGWFLAADDRFVFHADPRDEGNVQALTVFFTTFVMFQFWNTFNCRSLRHDESPFAQLGQNKLFLIIIGMITVVQVLVVQASGFCCIGEIFRSVALSPIQWLSILLLTATILPVGWLVRLGTDRFLRQIRFAGDY